MKHVLIYFLKLNYAVDMGRSRTDLMVKEGNVCLTREDFLCTYTGCIVQRLNFPLTRCKLTNAAAC